MCPLILRQVIFMQLMTYDAYLKERKKTAEEKEMQETLAAARKKHMAMRPPASNRYSPMM